MAAPVNPSNPRCFMDVSVDGEHEREMVDPKGGLCCVVGAWVDAAGRMVFELYVDKCPKVVENFRALCTGECGESDSSGQRLCYQGRSFHAVNEGETLVGGDLAGDGQGAAESIFGGAFDAQQELGVCKHDRAGVLSMQPQPASIMERDEAPGGAVGAEDERVEGQQGSRFGSQFAVTLRKCAARDGHALAFGRLLRGFGALRQIEKVDLGSRRQPLQPVVITACGELEPGDDGVVVGEDGDPFTPWPQDYPNMSDRGEQYLTRVAASETIKSFGNEAFNAGDFVTANRKYTKALRYLDKQYTREAETYMEETEHRAMQKRNSVPLLLNLAAVQLKLGDYRAAIVSCDEVHRWENMHRLATAAEVWNAKMLYRRGMARTACNEFEQGIADLGRAAMLEPANAAVRKELDKAVRRMEDRKRRERTAYSKMFG